MLYLEVLYRGCSILSLLLLEFISHTGFMCISITGCDMWQSLGKEVSGMEVPLWYIST